MRHRSLSLLALLVAASPVLGHAGPAGASPEASPSNDDFADAALVLPFVPATGSTVGATLEPGAPRACGLVGGTVWFRFENTLPVPVKVDTAGSDFDTTLAVFTGSATNAFTLKGCNDDADGSLQARVSVAVGPLETVMIQLAGAGGASGDYELRATY